MFCLVSSFSKYRESSINTVINKFWAWWHKLRNASRCICIVKYTAVRPRLLFAFDKVLRLAVLALHPSALRFIRQIAAGSVITLRSNGFMAMAGSLQLCPWRNDPALLTKIYSSRHRLNRTQFRRRPVLIKTLAT